MRLIQRAAQAKMDFPAKGVLLCSTSSAFVSGSGVSLSSRCSGASILGCQGSATCLLIVPFSLIKRAQLKIT